MSLGTLSIREVADLLGCADQTVRNLADRGVLESITERVATNKSWRITQASVLQLLAERARSNKADEQRARGARAAKESSVRGSDGESIDAAASDTMSPILSAGHDAVAPPLSAVDLLAQMLQQEHARRVLAEQLLEEAQAENRGLAARVASLEGYATFRTAASEETNLALEAAVDVQKHLTRAAEAERRAGEQLLHNVTVPTS